MPNGPEDKKDEKKRGQIIDEGGLTLSNIEAIPDSPIAVAIKEALDETGAPQITASGRGKIAEQILQLAFEHGIKVRKDSDLAAMLAKIDLDSPIPTEAFMAVAEILSYVYRANGEPNPFDAVLQDVIDKEDDFAQNTESDSGTTTDTPDKQQE